MEDINTLEYKIQMKERQAQEAKEKRMFAVHSNLLLEIQVLKYKLKKLQMGGK